ncbi:MAG: hypothetical protein QOH46_3249, partial [Solirubrobacteraceae bacterium]|nr:hypothetical protein [Solirubrobacteraceae bacterium]
WMLKAQKPEQLREAVRRAVGPGAEASRT